MLIVFQFHTFYFRYTKTKYYSANYEKESIDNGISITNRQLHYIFAPDGLAAILEVKDNNRTMYYASTDNLGSINLLVDKDGGIVSDQSYDAWGRQRNPVDWTYANITTNSITDRGFTGHEHLPYFSLINMNGRAYDPTIGQFLSPDPFVSFPENSQSYNRYAYCLNNPLKFIDPNGYWPVGSLLWSFSSEGQYFWNFCATYEPAYDKWEKNNSSNNFVSTDGIILNNSNNNKPSIDVLGLWNSWNLLNNTHSIPTKSFGGFELDQSTSLSSGIRDERDAFFGGTNYEDYLRNNYIKTERGMSANDFAPALPWGIAIKEMLNVTVSVAIRALGGILSLITLSGDTRIDRNKGNESYPGPWSYSYTHPTQNPINNPPKGFNPKEPPEGWGSPVNWAIAYRMMYELYNNFKKPNENLDSISMPVDRVNINSHYIPNHFKIR